MSNPPILELQHIRKAFPGVLALDDINLKVTTGEVHALVGENGAGKSTLIKILSGVYQPDAGILLYKGTAQGIPGPLEGQMLGISVVHQELNLIDELSVCENLFLGRPLMRSGILSPLINWKHMKAQGQLLLDRLHTHIDIGAKVRTLSVAQKQLVEIAKALSFDCEVMILDEPSATLTDRELEILFEVIGTLRIQGITIIYISHRLEEIFQIADSVTVLRDGMHIKTMAVSETDRNQLISLMVGRELGSEYPAWTRNHGETMLEVSHVSNERLHDISFAVQSGEILGIAGLVGSGRTELARALMGLDPIAQGNIVFKCHPVKFNDVTDAIEAGFGLVPEERKTQGLVLGMSVRENISLAAIDTVERHLLIDRKKDLAVASEHIKQLKIETPSTEQMVKYLSGGNQQKVVLAKWLLTDVSLLIFDEPTRGIDVGAKQEIYRLLATLVDSGKSIIMISSELPELLGMCDRIAVMHEGFLTGILDRTKASQEAIMHLAAG